MNDLKAVDIMSKEAVSLEKEVELSEALALMRKHNVHEIPIVCGRRLVGIVSYETLMKRRNIPLTTKVEKIMSLPPVVAPEDGLPDIAEALMAGGHRALPVTSNDKLMGIVSRGDVVRVMGKLDELKNLRIGSFMTPNPQCVGESDNILNARNVMRNLDERSVPVVDGSGKLTGVIGFKDLVDAFTKAKNEERLRLERTREINIEVKGLMRTPPITMDPKGEVAEAVALMVKNDISSIVVVEEGKPVGILTQVDLMELLTSFRTSPQLYVQITGLEETSELYDAMYSIITKGIKRIKHIVTPKILNLHVVQHHREGLRNKYSLRMRMATEKKMYYARAVEWDILKALDASMDSLERTVKKEKQRRVDMRRARKAAGSL